MTSGIGNPIGFRDAWQASHPIKGKYPSVWGYTVAADASAIAAQAKTLDHYGTEGVFVDYPTCQVRNRPAFKILIHPVYLREGDMLMLADPCALGIKPHAALVTKEELKARGLAFCIVGQDADCPALRAA